jgi:hypothetical protein
MYARRTRAPLAQFWTGFMAEQDFNSPNPSNGNMQRSLALNILQVDIDSLLPDAALEKVLKNFPRSGLGCLMKHVAA